MSERPSYLVILPPHGLFSSHWVEYDAFQMVDKLRSRGDNPDPYVIEVPQTDGISVTWRLEEPQEQRSIEERSDTTTAETISDSLTPKEAKE